MQEMFDTVAVEIFYSTGQKMLEFEADYCVNYQLPITGHYIHVLARIKSAS